MTFDADNMANGSATESHGFAATMLGAVVPYPRDTTVSELVEAQVALNPDAVAIVTDHHEITYAELNARANQLARYLRGMGVGQGTPVAISMDRSPELVAGVLAILKAGGAYVPLDRSYPRERLEFMLAQSGATVLLTTSGALDRLPTGQAAIVAVDSEWPVVAVESDQNLEQVATATDPCYIIFTSGSTGTPKGVEMAHRPLVNLLWWHLHAADAPGAGNPVARTLQFAPISFDVSFQEIFSTWTSGGTLVLVPEELRIDPDSLLEYINRHAIERLYLPVVALLQLADVHAAGGAAPATVREVITAGEALLVTPAVASLFAAMPGCTLHNHYGPSETHVVTAHTLSGDAAAWPKLPPIGRPIWNSAAWVLGEGLAPVAEGDEGELYLGGECLATGYVGRPDLTAERFVDIPDPLGSTGTRRAYKTGDRVRWVGGALEYLGRADQQIKIRGYRVEPGEIENALIAHDQVSQAAVVAKTYEDGEKALVGYVTSDKIPPPAVSEFRAYLRSTLPDYMIPATFVLVDALPMTPSGKVDRKALAERPIAAASPAEAPPAASVEDAIAAIWRQVLHVDEIGRDDSFFEVGGTSLQAVKMHRLIKAKFETEFPITILFEYPTINLLAKSLRESGLSRGDGNTSSQPARHRDPLEHIRHLRAQRDLQTH